jgi:hypothetical protein
MCSIFDVSTILIFVKSYFGTGKYVILGSVFCVLKALIELERHGQFLVNRSINTASGLQEF